jgi:hypothetical protein
VVGEHGRRSRWRRLRARWVLAALLVAVFLVAPTSAQAARDHCCFKVSVYFDGNITYDYGRDPANDYNGGGFYVWTWRLVTFVEYGEDARGRPVLNNLGPTKGEAEFREWTGSLTKRQSGTTTHDSIACEEVQATGRFVRSGALVSFSLAINGYLELNAPVEYDPRCDHVDFSHRPTQLGQEFPSVFVGGYALARGAWHYDIKAGSRKRYRQDRSFKLAHTDASSHAPDPQSSRPHEAHRNGVGNVSFTFVPESELRKERRKLRRCRQGCG